MFRPCFGAFGFSEDDALNFKRVQRCPLLHRRHHSPWHLPTGAPDQPSCCSRALSQAGLKLNHKCVFDVPKLTFLGHVVSGEGLFPLSSAIEAITKAPTPSNISELRSLLGLAGFYSKFIPHYSDVVEPMRALLRGSDSAFTWTAAADSSFKLLKSMLTSCDVLHFFDPALPVVVTTDASGYGLGAVLQQDNGHSLQTVAFAPVP